MTLPASRLPPEPAADAAGRSHTTQGAVLTQDASRWDLRPAPDDFPDDVWALGADLAPGTLVAAYRLGLFPMHVNGVLAWFSPPARGIVPLERRPSRRLRRARRGFEIRLDTAFGEVIRGCADPARPHGWLDEEFIAAYEELHRLGIAHSIEAWDGAGLAGGLYGVELGGLFAAESKFYRRTGASQAALCGLIERLQQAGDPDRRLLDVQWATPYLVGLGAVTVTRAEYRERLAVALGLPAALGETTGV